MRQIIQNPVYKGYVRWNNKSSAEVFGPDGEMVNVKRAISELADYSGRAEEEKRFLKSFIDRIEYEKDPETGKIRLGVYFKTPGQPAS